MSITEAAISKNRITGVAFGLILLAGIGTYFNMPRAEDPGFTIRTAVVTTVFPGASPERVELLVTDKVEKVVQEIPELDFVNSQSLTGVSVVYVNIQDRYDEMQPIWDDLRRKVEKVDLPDGAFRPQVNDEFGDVFGTILTITGPDHTYAELKTIADEIRDELLHVTDVAKIDIYGAQEERVFLDYNNARLAEVGLSPIQLQSLLEAQNIVIPGGSFDTADEAITLEPSGNFDSVDDLARTVITLPGRTDLLYLEDLVSVRRAYIDPAKTKLFGSGVPALALAISMREGGNIIELGKGVREVYAQIQTQYPVGVDFDIVAFQPDIVANLVSGFVGNVFQAVAIVVLMMLITMGLRTGLLVVWLIPMTMVMTLLVMSFLGVGLNQMSLSALIIALGMLVDNAIVMSESIMVRLEQGKERLEAAVASANELRIPLLTSSLTTAAAFLPFYLAQSTAGEYVGQLFVVVTIALLSSWFLSLTLIPMLCFFFMKVKVKSGDPFETRFYETYRGWIIAALKNRGLSLAAIGVAFVLAIMGLRFVPNIFFPPSDRATLTGELEMPVGTNIQRMERVAQAFDTFIANELTVNEEREAGVTNWATFVGQGGPRYVLTYSPPPNDAAIGFLMVNTSDRATVDEVIPKLEQFAFDNFPDLTAKFKPPQLGPPVDSPVQVRVSGRELDQLFAIVDRVKARIAEIEGTRSIVDDWGRQTKKMVVNINQPRARRAGVSSQDIAVSLQTNLSGFQTTEYREEDEVIPVVMRSVAADREDLGKIESLNIYSQATGQSVPLKQVADLVVVWQPAKVFRRDRLKTVTVDADLLPGFTATQINAELVPWLEAESDGWGFGYGWELEGEAETSGESQASIGAQLPLAVLIIVLLLVTQFNSIRRPLIVMLTIPLGIIGVTLGLILARSYLGFMTILGVVALAGIVINNAIVLIDRIDIEREDGQSAAAAIVQAAQQRLRPILVSTATTVGGMIPLWLGGGAMFKPMAIAIIFGLLFATVLTLGFVPVMYSLLFKVNFKGFRYTV